MQRSCFGGDFGSRATRCRRHRCCFGGGLGLLLCFLLYRRFRIRTRIRTRTGLHRRELLLLSWGGTTTGTRRWQGGHGVPVFGRSTAFSLDRRYEHRHCRRRWQCDGNGDGGSTRTATIMAHDSRRHHFLLWLFWLSSIVGSFHRNFRGRRRCVVAVAVVVFDVVVRRLDGRKGWWRFFALFHFRRKRRRIVICIQRRSSTLPLWSSSIGGGGSCHGPRKAVVATVLQCTAVVVNRSYLFASRDERRWLPEEAGRAAPACMRLRLIVNRMAHTYSRLQYELYDDCARIINNSDLFFSFLVDLRGYQYLYSQRYLYLVLSTEYWTSRAHAAKWIVAYLPVPRN
jgi:hypothetical protein